MSSYIGMPSLTESSEKFPWKFGLLRNSGCPKSSTELCRLNRAIELGQHCLLYNTGFKYRLWPAYAVLKRPHIMNQLLFTWSYRTVCVNPHLEQAESQYLVSSIINQQSLALSLFSFSPVAFHRDSIEASIEMPVLVVTALPGFDWKGK